MPTTKQCKFWHWIIWWLSIFYFSLLFHLCFWICMREFRVVVWLWRPLQWIIVFSTLQKAMESQEFHHRCFCCFSRSAFLHKAAHCSLLTDLLIHAVEQLNGCFIAHVDRGNAGISKCLRSQWTQRVHCHCYLLTGRKGNGSGQQSSKEYSSHALLLVSLLC